MKLIEILCGEDDMFPELTLIVPAHLEAETRAALDRTLAEVKREYGPDWEMDDFRRTMELPEGVHVVHSNAPDWVAKRD